MNLGYDPARTVFGVCQQKMLTVTLFDEKVFGDWESVGWKQVEQTANDIVVAIANGFGFDPAFFQCRSFNLIDGTEAQVGLDVTVVSNSQGDQVLELKTEIGLAVQYYLCLVLGDFDPRQSDWLSVTDMLDAEVVDRLEKFAADHLTRHGGKAIHVPLNVVVGKQALKVNGSFAAKPPMPRLPSATLEVCGQVAGLRSTRKDLMILMGDGDEMDIGCDPDRFASLLRNAIHTNRRFKFSIAVGKDARGRDERMLLNAEEIEVLANDFLT